MGPSHGFDYIFSTLARRLQISGWVAEEMMVADFVYDDVKRNKQMRRLRTPASCLFGLTERRCDLSWRIFAVCWTQDAA
jgi:hypothetical protein